MASNYKRKKYSEQSKGFQFTNRISAKEKELLELEKERREVYTQIKSIQKDKNMRKADKDKRLPNLYNRYYDLKEQVRNIGFLPEGTLKTEFEHLLRNGKFDVHLLKRCN